MRPIKFRAWDKDAKIMRTVTNLNFYDECILCDESPSGNYTRLSLEQTTLMQFTGLLDKNGKEIYEGDIYKSWFGMQALEVANGEVTKYSDDPIVRQFHDVRLTFVIFPEGMDMRCIEIIGNIYENPELLKH